ncbi:MAG: SDR family oxidoreductase [Methanothrix sp.]|nr:SDR family oxidoreductase [Methanothrix sp.]
MSGRIDDKVAIVTGSGRGIGKAIAKRFASEGAYVVVNDLHSKRLEETRQEIETITKAQQKFCRAVVADVTVKSDAVRLIEEAISTWGRVDILVNNAGGPMRTPRWAEDVSEEDFARVIDINLKGAFFCSQGVIPHMKKQNYGRMINISSRTARSGGWIPGPGGYQAAATGPQYAAAKGGIISLTKQLAVDLGSFGITVNCVAPGVTRSDLMEKFWQNLNEADQESLLRLIPLRRLGTPEEVASLVLFLASDEAGYITGTTIDINGGWYMG